jgi:cell division protein FtsZ
MREYHEVMNTIKEFTAEDAMVIVGTVIDDVMEDRLRVTMVATGLGGAAAAKARTPNITLVDPPIVRTGTDNVAMTVETINFDDLEAPAVVRRGRAGVSGSQSVPAFDATEIPAFLRKQAD